jgi:hypothetical protein
MLGIVIGVAPIGGEYKIGRALLAPEEREVLHSIVNFAAGLRGGEVGWPGFSPDPNHHGT